MTGQQLKVAVLNQQEERNPLAIAQCLNEISITRQCRLRMAKHWDECFTVEQLLADIQTRCKLPIGTQLYGPIGRLARQKGLIEETGTWVEALRDSRHAGRVPVCYWLP